MGTESLIGKLEALRDTLLDSRNPVCVLDDILEIVRQHETDTAGKTPPLSGVLPPITTDTLSGYTQEQSSVFDWAANHGFTPVTSEINDLLLALKLSEISLWHPADRREAFEKSAKAEGLGVIRNHKDPDMYESLYTQFAWQGFKMACDLRIPARGVSSEIPVISEQALHDMLMDGSYSMIEEGADSGIMVVSVDEAVEAVMPYIATKQEQGEISVKAEHLQKMLTYLDGMESQGFTSMVMANFFAHWKDDIRQLANSALSSPVREISEQQLLTWRYWAKCAAETGTVEAANFNALQVVNQINNELAERKRNQSEGGQS